MPDVRQTGHTKGIKCPRCGKLVDTVVKIYTIGKMKSRMEPCGHIILIKSTKEAEVRK